MDISTCNACGCFARQITNESVTSKERKAGVFRDVNMDYFHCDCGNIFLIHKASNDLVVNILNELRHRVENFKLK